MSDLYIQPGNDGGDIIIVGKDAQTTTAIEVAVWLSLFTDQSWADMSREIGRRYTSRLPEIIRTRTVSNQTRLAMMTAAENALAWMVDEGVASNVTADATISSANRIDLTVTIEKPENTATFAYAVNWDGQIELLEATT